MSFAYTLLKVGTDAESFLTKKGKPWPGIGLFGGTKLHPLAVPELGEGFFIQEDNVMPEFNIPASATADEFAENIGRMHSWLVAQSSAKGLDLAIVPSMVFTPKQLDHPQAQEVGCEPDFCVWTRRVNESPKANPAMATLRTASAHIHVSFLVNNKLPADIFVREAVVKAMDMTIGLPSVILDRDTERRKLYGKAGAFRPKEYGIEHRVASNFWITTPKLRKWAFDGVVKAIALANEDKGKWLKAYCREYAGTIQTAINTSRADTAQALLERLGLVDRIAV